MKKDKTTEVKSELEKWQMDYFLTFGRTYENHVNKYIRYMKFINKANTPAHITMSDIDGCVGYYVNEGSIKTISSMNAHLESIKSFYEYLRKNGKSLHIFSERSYEDFKESLTSKYDLTKKVTRDTFSNDTIIDILSKLDEYLKQDYFSLNGEKLHNRYFHRVVLRLFSKLTLIAPAKRNVICSLKRSDFDSNFRAVCVNNVNIALPNSLHRDIMKDLELREVIINRKIDENECIFKYLIGETFEDEDLNRWFYSFIKEVGIYGIDKLPNKPESYPVEPIMKTAISNLMKIKANMAYVSAICGTSIGNLEKTYKYEIFEFHEMNIDIGEQIDWEIRKSPYYTYI